MFWWRWTPHWYRAKALLDVHLLLAPSNKISTFNEYPCYINLNGQYSNTISFSTGMLQQQISSLTSVMMLQTGRVHMYAKFHWLSLKRSCIFASYKRDGGRPFPHQLIWACILVDSLPINRNFHRQKFLWVKVFDNDKA